MSRQFRRAREEIEMGVHSLSCAVGHLTDILAKYRPIITDGDMEAIELSSLELTALLEKAMELEALEAAE